LAIYLIFHNDAANTMQFIYKYLQLMKPSTRSTVCFDSICLKSGKHKIYTIKFDPIKYETAPQSKICE